MMASAMRNMTPRSSLGKFNRFWRIVGLNEEEGLEAEDSAPTPQARMEDKMFDFLKSALRANEETCYV